MIPICVSIEIESVLCAPHEMMVIEQHLRENIPNVLVDLLRDPLQEDKWRLRVNDGALSLTVDWDIKEPLFRVCIPEDGFEGPERLDCPRSVWEYIIRWFVG